MATAAVIPPVFLEGLTATVGLGHSPLELLLIISTNRER